MFRLRRALKADALWVPARVWCFAAVQDGTGNLSQYQPDELAEAIGYTGNAASMVTALKDAGYVDDAGMIVGWSELYGLAASRASSAKKAAAARWNRPPTPPIDPEEKRVRGEAHALPDGMRDASTPTHTTASLSLSESECAAVAQDFNTQPERIRSCLRIFNDIKANYPQDPRTLDAFRGWMRTAKQAKAFLSYTPEDPEPPAFQEFFDQHHPDSVFATGRDRCRPWAKHTTHDRKTIRELMAEHAAKEQPAA